MAGKIFVNYRRDDSAPHALSIASYLEKAFGSRNVFLDIDRMRAGQQFPVVLEERLNACKVMLAVIGPSWLNQTSENGQRRLDDPQDWVRMEIARALARGITVIPVLVGGAPLPKKAELPAELQPLIDRHAAAITTNGFRNEMAGLVRDIKAIPSPLSAGQIGGIGGVVAATLLAAWIGAHQAGAPVWWPFAPAQPPLDDAAATSLRLEQERRKADDDAFAEAKSKNTAADFVAYHTLFPGGRHSAEVNELARALIRRKEAEDLQRAEAQRKKEADEKAQADAAEAERKRLAAAEAERVAAEQRKKKADEEAARLEAERKRLADIEAARKRDPVAALEPGAGKAQWVRDNLADGGPCPSCPEMVVVPSGSFVMGSPESEPQSYSDESPQVSVTIAAPFAVGRFAVTFDEWDACVADGGCNGYKPADQGWGRGKRPVINVSWDDAKAYAAWLSKKTGKRYRLLSEAEREYVTRAGTKTPFWWGTSITPNEANYDGSAEPYKGGGAKGEYRQRTVTVDSFKPNPWGLYNVHGNVWEWAEDCWNNSNSGNPGNGSPRTAGDCSRRVVRGGSWFSFPQSLRSAFRNWNSTDDRSGLLGFRVGRTLE